MPIPVSFRDDELEDSQDVAWWCSNSKSWPPVRRCVGPREFVGQVAVSEESTWEGGKLSLEPIHHVQLETSNHHSTAAIVWRPKSDI